MGTDAGGIASIWVLDVNEEGGDMEEKKRVACWFMGMIVDWLGGSCELRMSLCPTD
jgi:hypothetical protein